MFLRNKSVDNINEEHQTNDINKYEGDKRNYRLRPSLTQMTAPTLMYLIYGTALLSAAALHHDDH